MASETFTIRLPPSIFQRADDLVDPLEDTLMAAAAGGSWGRAAVLRVAIAKGLEALEKELAAIHESLDEPAKQ